MRFKKGSKIEVLKGREVFSMSWWPAEILSGNGHTYCVGYERSSGEDDQPLMERVPRKAIRPRPPLIAGMENWIPGDVIEVFDNSSWKTAKILEVVDTGHCFFVRLIGSSQQFGAYAPNVRVRQSWVNNQWVVIGEASRSCEDGKANRLSIGRCKGKPKYQEPDVTAEVRVRDNRLAFKDQIYFQKSHMFSFRGMKRESQFCISHSNPKLGTRQKMRTIEKNGRRQRWASRNPSLFMKKVDAVASPGTPLGDNYMHASFSKISGSFDMGTDRGNPNGEERCLLTRSLEADDACSVASCSTTNPTPYFSPHQDKKDPSSDTISHFGDTESSSGQDCGRGCFFPSKEELAAEIHKLELHAYRATMEALYASGPLSWKQEAMMTNLRLSLHISNDEHLLELRHLVSAEQTVL